MSIPIESKDVYNSNCRGHGQRTEEYLQRYLDESNYAREDDKESRLELCLLLVHCYEVRFLLFCNFILCDFVLSSWLSAITMTLIFNLFWKGDKLRLKKSLYKFSFAKT